MKKLWISIVYILIILISCKKEEIKPVTNNTEAEANEALYELMYEWYLWYNNLPHVKPSAYTDPYELMAALRYKPYDRWSFVADYKEFIASMEGTFVGHGIRMGLDASKKVRIVMIYKNSPLYKDGVRRGWIIKKLNGVDLASVFLAGDLTTYNQLIGPSEEGYINIFTFENPQGAEVTITTPKAKFTVNSVLADTIYNLSSGKTAYLAFNEFIEPSSNELLASFQKFYNNNVKDLILDMRYNSGGILSVATKLASYISGPPIPNVLVKCMYNDKKYNENSDEYFKSIENTLNLSRLVVICTYETASASEVIINGLKPYIDVILVGDTTHGKPTGMRVWAYPGNNPKYVYAPVTFKMVNKNNYGDFFNGFPPDKYATDDITHDFGDLNEYCLKEAVFYIENGSFSVKSAYPYSRIHYFAEKPDLMNNAYLIDRIR
ncbi:MAG: S41 family peptidase [Bacteroidales bacterium]